MFSLRSLLAAITKIGLLNVPLCDSTAVFCELRASERKFGRSLSKVPWPTELSAVAAAVGVGVVLGVSVVVGDAVTEGAGEPIADGLPPPANRAIARTISMASAITASRIHSQTGSGPRR